MQKFDKSMIIKQTIGMPISNYGFAYIGYIDESWLYRNQINNELFQEIRILSVADNGLKIYFLTNAYGRRPIYGEDLVNEGEDRGDYLGVYKYNNEQEFIKITEYLKFIIFKYGLKALESISEPIEERPNGEMNLYLYNNHNILNKQHQNELNINDDTTHEDVFAIIQSNLITSQRQDFKDSKDLLLGSAAVIGTIYVNASGGDWEWDAKRSICWVTKMDDYPKRVYPLSIIINCWNGKPDKTYKILCMYYKSITK